MQRASLLSFMSLPILLTATSLYAELQPPVDATVVAKVGNQAITQQQMNEALRQPLYDIEAQRYETQKGWIEQQVDAILLDQEAARRKLTREKLEAKEITEKAVKVSDAEVKKFYDDNKERFKKSEKEYEPFDSMKSKILEHLQSQSQSTRRSAYLAELRKQTPVSIQLVKPEPPKIAVSYGPNDPVLGKPEAPVTILEFTDMQCPYCVRSQETIHAILKKYPSQVKVVSRCYPLPFHPRARPLALAALCAKDQGKYEAYRDNVFGKDTLDDKALIEEAGKLGMNKTDFEKCFSSKKFNPQIEKDIKEGNSYGVSGTPAFFVNGYFLSGARPIEDFDELIKKALAEKS